MLDFKEPKITDKPWVDQCLSHAHSMNLPVYIWQHFRLAHGVCDLHLPLQGLFADPLRQRGRYCVFAPGGHRRFCRCACEKRCLQQDAAENGVTLRLLGVTASYKELLEADFPGKFNYTYSDDYNDYIYSVEKMANLSGKKYHGKRGHITYFMKAHPDWQFEVLTPENVGSALPCIPAGLTRKTKRNKRRGRRVFPGV